MKKNKIVILSSNFLPDQSAGSERTYALLKEFIKTNLNLEIHILTTKPKRYGLILNKESTQTKKDLIASYEKIHIRRFWIPYLGNSIYAAAFAYLFFFIQALPYSLLLRPKLVFGTSAKLLTSFLATCIAKLNNSQLFIDYRDTFVDNYFYFYRWNKKIYFLIVFILLENFVFKSADSINFVSKGFKEAFLGLNKIKKLNCTITFFPNCIQPDIKNKIKQSIKKKNKIILKNKSYEVSYFGNLGEGQDILGLLKNINQDKEVLEIFHRENIKINIFGSGSQLKNIKKLIQDDKKNKNTKKKLSDFIHYGGLIYKKNIHTEYAKPDCLFLQLSKIKSLEMVIPTKVFEYSATNLPIIFGASGFTKDLIEKIEGTISYKQSDPESFLKAIQESKKISIDLEKREEFLRNFDSTLIYPKFINHIIKESNL